MRCKKCGYNNVSFMKDSSKGWAKDNIIWHKLLLPDMMIVGFLIMLLILSWAYKQDLNTFEEAISECREQNQLPGLPESYTLINTNYNWTTNTPTTSPNG